ASLEIVLGLKDDEPTAWDGEVKVSQGKVISLRFQRAGPQQAKVNGSTFTLRSFRRNLPMGQALLRPILHVDLAAPEAARVPLTPHPKPLSFTSPPNNSPTGPQKPSWAAMPTTDPTNTSSPPPGRPTETAPPPRTRGPEGTARWRCSNTHPAPPFQRERVLNG